jgi:uncharacterized membrane protein
MSTFQLLAIMLVVYYISYKGIKTIARTSQVIIILFVIALIFAVFTFRVETHWDNILPVMPDGAGGVIQAVDKHFVWFGDFTPFLFLTLQDKKKDKDKFSIPLLLILTYIAVIFFMLLFTAIYGGAGVLISHAFAELTVFSNADGLEAFMFPLILCWLMMAVIRLALLTFTAISAGQIVFKKRLPVTIVLFIATFILMNFFGDIDKAYQISTSPSRYFALSLMYGIPLGLTVFVTVQKKLDEKKKKKEGKTLANNEEPQTQKTFNYCRFGGFNTCFLFRHTKN